MAFMKPMLLLSLIKMEKLIFQQWHRLVVLTQVAKTIFIKKYTVQLLEALKMGLFISMIASKTNRPAALVVLDPVGPPKIYTLE